MADNKPAYSVHTAEMDGTARYFTAFTNDSGAKQEIEINYEIYLALEDYRLIEKRQENEFDRHREHFQLSEAQLAARTLRPPQPMEEAVAQALDMQAALDELPPDQRRRFLLSHEMGLSFSEIARDENLSRQAIAQSIGRAEEKIKNILSVGVDKVGSE